MRILVLGDPRSGGGGGSAREWARRAGFDPSSTLLDEAIGSALAQADVAWCHAPHCVPQADPATARALQDWVHAGGHLLLTLLATPLAVVAGARDRVPEIVLPQPWRHDADPLWAGAFRDWPDFPHVRGLQGWGEHPLFDGLARGAFTWRATEGEVVARTFLRRRSAPAARIIGVERAYVRLDADTAVAWEYHVGAGHVMCIGAHLLLDMADVLQAPQRDHLLVNALAYLDPRRDVRRTRRTWWLGHGADRDRAFGECVLAPVPIVPATAYESVGPMATIDAPGADAVVLAGRRILLVGSERGGLSELWCHPLCVASGSPPARAGGHPLAAQTVTVSPGVMQRVLRDAYGRRWHEIVAVAPDRAGVVLQLTEVPAAVAATLPDAAAPATADREATSPNLSRVPVAHPAPSVILDVPLRLRLQWPWPADALHPVTATVMGAAPRWSVLVTTADPRISAAILIDGASDVALQGEGPDPRLRVVVGGTSGMRLAVTATTDGTAALAPELRALAEGGVPRILAERSAADRTRRASTVSLQTPLPDLDDACAWAIARLASHVVRVPSLGSGLVAGYAASSPGWGDSRPGYAWFFGRDACWSADALLAAGMFEEARSALELLARTSDVTGKIAHEVTLSGAVHYDAADATPLWLRLVCAYAEWTGDLATVRALWDVVRSAFAFTCATDRDGDGLPENTDHGHGWIESGPLGGGAVTSYTAAIWIDAVTRLAPLAALVGDDALAARAQEARLRAIDGVDRRLRDPLTGRSALHLDHTGARNDTLTALAAVPIALGVDTGSAAEDTLDRLAAPDFTTPWGVRLIDRASPAYRPKGYHAGAVWPLFTGWLALAEFRCWRAEAGLAHLLAVANGSTHRTRGAFDEVLDGDTGGGAGVCPDQAWSAAMVISPVVLGLLGMRPSAASRRCRFAPRWPAGWSAATFRQLRVGGSRVTLEARRATADGGASTGWCCRFTLEGGDPLTLTLEGPDGMSIEGTLDGATPLSLELPPSARASGGRGGRR